MFGVIDDIVNCPQCGMPATKHNYHVTGEESVACDYCGYTHDKTLTGKSSSKGYGCIHYAGKDENGNDTDNIIRLRSRLSLLERQKIINDLRNNYGSKSAFFIWNENRNELECIIGTKPMTLDEWYEKQKLEAEWIARQHYVTEPEDLF